MAINLILDDKPVTVPPGTLVIDAAKRVGINIPVFCYHPKLKSVGMCRMCLVEIGLPAVDRGTKQPILDENGQQKIAWNPKLQTACTTPVSEGMQVRTQSDKVKAAQRAVLEFLLTSHPLDCPICDKGGECPLQNLTLAYGPGETRFEFLDKQLLDKHVPLGDLIWLDRERCIQCARCIRFLDEIAGDHVLGFSERGRKLQIITFSDPSFDSYFSGNTTDICPVGALTAVDFHFRARPWELTNVPSLCDHCAVGCNITLCTRRSARHSGSWEILRVMPRQNEQVNELWICDKGRFGHGHAHAPDRLAQPLVRWGDQFKPVSWDEALAIVSEKLKAASGNVAGLVGDRIPNEDVYLLAKLFHEGLKSDALQLYPRVSGAQVAQQYGLGSGTNLGKLDLSNSLVLVAGANLKEEAPIWYLRLRNRAKVLQIADCRSFDYASASTGRARQRRPHQRCPVDADWRERQELQDKFQPNECLQCKEGTETYAVLGLLNVILTEELVKEDVATRVDGLEELKVEVTGYSPVKVSELTGLPVEAIVDIARALVEMENVIFAFGTPGAPESLPQHLANLAVLTGHIARPNNGLLPVWPHANTQGVLDQISDFGFRVSDPQSPISNLQSPVLYILGADPVSDGEALPESAFVVCHELFLTETARKADLILPALSWAERDGTFTSAERRVQRFYRALPPLGEARPDWEILRDIARKLGLDWTYTSSVKIMEELAANVPRYAGVTYTRLAQAGEQWPPAGYNDLYFSGTAYANRAGLGVQLPASCESSRRYEVMWSEPGQTVIKRRRLYQRGTLINASEVLRRRMTNDERRMTKWTLG